MSGTTRAQGDSHFLRPRAGLRTIKQLCDDMAEQEARNAVYHTLIAVDTDVATMAAFPLENIAVGSVFHAWEPLRELSAQVADAVMKGDTRARTEVLERIFGCSKSRIPLLTTIALSEFVFNRRGPIERFATYVLLPPYRPEWQKRTQRAREDAQNWQRSLAKRVDVGKITAIVQRARLEERDVAELLIDALPESASVLFPSQLSPDHALATFIDWKLSGAIKDYDKIPALLPKFDTYVHERAEGTRLETWRKILQADAAALPRLASLTDEQRAQALKELEARNTTDANVLVFLEAVRERCPEVEFEGERRPLRVILLTASPKLWRVARAEGLAGDCLRNPIAYLSDGRFFEWAFSAAPRENQEQLLQRLRQGLLGQWLKPLTESVDTAEEDRTKHAHLECVRQWERLMSHLATALNLASPSSGLRRALREALDGDDMPESIAALLQHKIVDATNRLTQFASEVGLAHVRSDTVTLRNLPPINLSGYPEAERLLIRIATDQLDRDDIRLKLLKDVMKVAVDAQSEKERHVARSYLQSVLISLFWFRLQHWDVAHDVAGQAASYALGKDPDDADTESADAVMSNIIGDEALYLVAVTSRICAKDRKDLELPRMALEFAIKLAGENRDDLRFQSEMHSLAVAEVLVEWTPPTNAGLGMLAGIRLSSLLNDALRSFTTKPWVATRKAVIRQTRARGVSKLGAYGQRYAVQQMYCAIGMLFLLALDARAVDDKQREGMREIVAEFGRFARTQSAESSDAFTLADSQVAKPIRVLLQLELVPKECEVRAPKTYFEHLAAEESRQRMSRLDCRRLEWLVDAFKRRSHK